MTFGTTKTGCMYHALSYGQLRCDNRKTPHRIVELEEYPHMFCNLCERIVGKKQKPKGQWYYQI